MELVIESFVEEMLQIFLGIGSAAIAAGTAVLVRWLHRKTKTETLGEYVSMLAFYAEIAVKNIAQTQADLFKEAAADGKLTAAEKEQMKGAALENLKVIAPDALLAFMKKANSDIEKLMETLIESAVHEKNNGGGYDNA